MKFRVIRGVFTWLMIGGFGLIIYGGPLALMLTVGFQFSPYKIFIYKKIREIDSSKFHEF